MSNCNKVSSKCKKVSIGGQAVMEGVMMRGESSMATAVRDADGIVRIEAKRIKPTKEKSLFLRLPIVRGVVSFISSLFTGMRVLLRSAEVYGEEEPSRLEKWLAEKLKIDIFSVIGTFAVFIGLFLAVFLFMWLPQATRGLLERLFSISFGVWATNFIEGGLKLLIFILYILLCSLIKDVNRTFMYHGAEHKTISCHEKGFELTVENAKKCSRVHDRCGTTFMVFVMLISILTFAVFESLVGESLDGILRVGCKLLLLPIVAGLSYELLKGLAKTSCWVFYPLKVPGLLLQKITTKEPDDDMIEVAIVAFKKVMEMDNDHSIPECDFVLPKKCSQLVKETKELLKKGGIEEDAEAEWILSIILNVKRSELDSDKLITPKHIERINNVVEERLSGKPLWYCIGDTEFYGYTIKVDQRVLIPRPETEILVEKALKCIEKDHKVLDLCTGSGAIAISIKKESDATVFASDVSGDALELAKENAKNNGADIIFIESDLFNAFGEEKFDVIVTNPPYIRSSDILTLQKEVKDFEPMLALDGGEDGLDFYRIIARECPKFLNEKGVILLEIGYNQGEDVKNLFSEFSSVEIIKDYENNDRIIKAVF